MTKTISTLSLLFVALAALSACKPHPTNPHHGSDFCPPGQAKHGNC